MVARTAVPALGDQVAADRKEDGHGDRAQRVPVREQMRFRQAVQRKAVTQEDAGSGCDPQEVERILISHHAPLELRSAMDGKRHAAGVPLKRRIVACECHNASLHRPDRVPRTWRSPQLGGLASDRDNAMWCKWRSMSTTPAVLPNPPRHRA